jgi:hypothetical protein
MKAFIDQKGVLNVKAESETEAYALQIWYKRFDTYLVFDSIDRLLDSFDDCSERTTLFIDAERSY